MSQRATTMSTAIIIMALLCGSLAAAPPRQLRVCADPNNLPFSNERGEGFENKIAAILADELGAALHYTWWAQRRGFVRNTLKAGRCDLLIAVPGQFELASTTAPYYRSSYVFVYRKDRNYRIDSFDAPALRKLRIGVHLIGDDYANTPPAHALSDRNMIDNVVGFSIYGDYREPDPPARIIDALAAGEIDVAIVWGPLAGFFAPRAAVALEFVPVAPQVERGVPPMAFDIAMAVRHGDGALRQEVEAAIGRRRADIDAVLAAYGVPQAPVRAKPGDAK